MRIFLAGASGVIGIRLLPPLVSAGHQVTGMTRSPQKVPALEALGAEPVFCDVYDAEALRTAVIEFRPDTVVHQLTDLPDDAAMIPELARPQRPNAPGGNRESPQRGCGRERPGGSSLRASPGSCPGSAA